MSIFLYLVVRVNVLFMIAVREKKRLKSTGLGYLYSIICLPWLLHIPSLTDVTMVTKACTLLWGKSDIKAVM
jgi:hypothetical protein